MHIKIFIYHACESFCDDFIVLVLFCRSATESTRSKWQRQLNEVWKCFIAKSGFFDIYENILCPQFRQKAQRIEMQLLFYFGFMIIPVGLSESDGMLHLNSEVWADKCHLNELWYVYFFHSQWSQQNFEYETWMDFQGK